MSDQLEPSQPQPRQGGSTNDERLYELIAAYLDATREGRSPDRDRLLGERRDLATDLEAFFAITTGCDNGSNRRPFAPRPPDRRSETGRSLRIRRTSRHWRLVKRWNPATRSARRAPRSAVLGITNSWR